jgi:pyruvyltransferase
MDKIYVRWCKQPNWGDELNISLVENISGKKVEWTNTHDGISKEKNIVIGSIIQWADQYTNVWGSGFISEGSRMQVEPKNIFAVRGPMTRDILLSQGFKCPEIYGDPALLYPRFYSPKKSKVYKIGIVPHYIDKDSEWIKLLRKNPEVLIIDVTGKTNKFVDDICSCERIASSSLHGIIGADAYGIPSLWIELSKKVIGNGFKFRDYFMSVGREDKYPLIVNKATTLKEIYSSFNNYEIKIDLDKLYESCPFKK